MAARVKDLSEELVESALGGDGFGDLVGTALITETTWMQHPGFTDTYVDSERGVYWFDVDDLQRDLDDGTLTGSDQQVRLLRAAIAMQRRDPVEWGDLTPDEYALVKKVISDQKLQDMEEDWNLLGPDERELLKVVIDDR